MSDFEEYLRQGEAVPGKRAQAWQAAIGLQDVDGLKTSEYLVQTARRHIEGDITIGEAQELIDTYYRSKDVRADVETRTEEADKVAARIAELLSEETFSFAPGELSRIHRKLFTGIIKGAGEYRSYNISKKEWVLDGASVLYNPFENIAETLDYDFSLERAFDYSQLDARQSIEHIAAFIAGIWQIHPFGEGNTRTTAVFLIKYLRRFGYHVATDLFANHSWYFRNALVRANYMNRERNIQPTLSFLQQFLGNLVLGEQNELKNRYLHISYVEDPKCKNCTLDCTLEEKALLTYLKDNPKATQKQMADHLNCSVRTVKTMTVKLQNAGALLRQGGRREGWWEVLWRELPISSSSMTSTGTSVTAGAATCPEQDNT